MKQIRMVERDCLSGNMLISIPNYTVSWKLLDHRIEMVVSGSENVETIVKILFFNGVGDINIVKSKVGREESDRAYRMKIMVDR